MADSSLGVGEGLVLDLDCTFSPWLMRQKSMELFSSSVMSLKSLGEENFFLIAIATTFLVSSSLELSPFESHS